MTYKKFIGYRILLLSIFIVVFSILSSQNMIGLENNEAEEYTNFLEANEREQMITTLNKRTMDMVQLSTEWNSLTTLPGSYATGGELMMTVHVNNSIYIMGGVVEGTTNNPEVWSYNILEANWTQHSNMLQGASGMGITHYDGKIYAGSLFGNDFLQIYDIETDTWMYGANMPEGRYDYGMIAIDGFIYLPSGGDVEVYVGTNTLFIYNISNDSWYYGPELPVPREGIYGLAEIDNKVYVAGGADYNIADSVLDSLHIFDIDSDLWTEGANLPLGLAYHGVAGIDKYVIVVGGWDSEWNMVDYAFLYNTQNDSWINIQNLPARLAEPGITSNNTTVFFVGGLYEDYVTRSNRIYMLDMTEFIESEVVSSKFIIESPTNTTYVTSDILLNISYNVSEVLSINYTINNYTVLEYDLPIILNLTDGTHLLEVWAYLNDNTTEYQNVSFVVDTMNPYILGFEIDSYLNIVNTPIYINVSSSNDSSVYLNIFGDNNNYTFSLVQGQNEINLIENDTGRFDFVVFANDSYSRVSENISDYFEVFEELNLSLHILDRNNINVTSSLGLYYRHLTVLLDSLSYKSFFLLPNAVMDMSIVRNDSVVSLNVNDADFTSYENVSYEIILDYEIIEDLRKDSYYYVSLPIESYKSTVSINLENLNKNEQQLSHLLFFECTNYNFSSNSCNNEYVNITSDIIVNTEESSFERQVQIGQTSIKLVQDSFCGDYICDSNEDCSTCSADCGTCPVQQTPSSGGSSGGGSGSSEAIGLQNVFNPNNVNTNSCENIWICEEWSSCTDGLQTRQCNQESLDCDSTIRPTEIRDCVDTPGMHRPEQLFDIRFEVTGSVFTVDSKIETITYFESFGSVPTPVNLTYRIINSLGETVYSEQDLIIVEVENVLIKYFDIIDLEPGDYDIVLTTAYSDGVVDDFRQSISVLGDEVVDSEDNKVIKVLVMLIFFIVASIFVFLFFKGKGKMHMRNDFEIERKGQLSSCMILLIVAIVFLLFSVVLMSYTFEKKVKSVEIESISHHLQDFANMKGYALNNYFASEKSHIEFIAQLIRVREYLENQDNPYYIERARDALIEYGSEKNRIAIIDTKGFVILALNKTPIVVDYSQNDYFALENPPTMFSKYYNPSYNKDLYIVASPVYNDNGEVIGYITYDIAVESINDYLSDINSAVISEAFIIDDTGIMISAYRQGYDTYDLTLFAQEVRTIPSSQCLKNIDTNNVYGSTYSEYVNHRGYDVIGAYAHIPIIDACIFVEKYK